MEGWKRSVRAEWREREREREKKARVAMVTKLLITFIWPEMTRGDPAVFFFFFFSLPGTILSPPAECVSRVLDSQLRRACMCVYTRVSGKVKPVDGLERHFETPMNSFPILHGWISLLLRGPSSRKSFMDLYISSARRGRDYCRESCGRIMAFPSSFTCGRSYYNFVRIY